MNTESPAKIQLNQITKRFGNKVVLDEIDLAVRDKESMVIIGGSGSGKSVLIKNIIGLMRPDSGTVLIDGDDVTNYSENERNKLMHKFGMLFQGGALFDSLKVWHNICFSLMNQKKYSKAELYDIAVDKLASVGLGGEVADLYPSELSGGMQKRVSLARAIADNPEIIFFDEPTTGLDPIMAEIINDLIVKCSEELGATTITITHDMHSARKIADKIAMIYEGKLRWEGPIDELDRSGNDYIEQFIHAKADGPIKIQLNDH